jgi:hypothetical protein
VILPFCKWFIKYILCEFFKNHLMALSQSGQKVVGLDNQKKNSNVFSNYLFPYFIGKPYIYSNFKRFEKLVDQRSLSLDLFCTPNFLHGLNPHHFYQIHVSLIHDDILQGKCKCPVNTRFNQLCIVLEKLTWNVLHRFWFPWSCTRNNRLK